MKHQIVHLEIPADDVKRAQAFYGELFGWQFSNPPGFDDYWGADVGEDASHGIGMMARQNPDHGPTYYVGVESVADSLAKPNKQLLRMDLRLSTRVVTRREIDLFLRIHSLVSWNTYPLHSRLRWDTPGTIFKRRASPRS